MRPSSRKTTILIPKSDITICSSAEWAAIFRRKGKIKNFHIARSQNGLFVGASGISGFERRLDSKKINFEIRNSSFVDCSETCLEVSHNCSVAIKNTFFRGGYKFSDEGNKSFLIKIHGSEVFFHDCHFQNSKKMIFIGPNSKVFFIGCKFSVGDIGVVASGGQYPLKDQFFLGKGPTIVHFSGTNVHKIQTLCRIETGASALIEDRYKNISFLDGGVYL